MSKKGETGEGMEDGRGVKEGRRGRGGRRGLGGEEASRASRLGHGGWVRNKQTHGGIDRCCQACSSRIIPRDRAHGGVCVCGGVRVALVAVLAAAAAVLAPGARARARAAAAAAAAAAVCAWQCARSGAWVGAVVVVGRWGV